MYVCVEHSQLLWFEFHQANIRAACYQGGIKAMDSECDGVIGRRILASTFIGGPRHMQQLYQDAMALVSQFGHPSLFITMTANTNWPEILECLGDQQKPEDRPDLVARVFHLKFQELLRDCTKKKQFGKCLSYCYTIEFQKRGLPHVHLILILDSASIPRTADDIDLLISSELPCSESEPQLYSAVTQFMLHGPCESRKCWTGS